jgi:uncharacterized protein YfaS (alpha-2-macroglobulin family)
MYNLLVRRIIQMSIDSVIYYFTSAIDTFKLSFKNYQGAISMVRNQWRTFARQSFALTFLLFFNAQASEVISFFPTGSVKQVQQVTVRFSEDMIAMGDPRSKNDPFIISCNEASQNQESEEEQDSTAVKNPKFTTRWADNKNWVLDFEKPLKSGMRCNFKLKSDVKSLLGAKVKGLDQYSFSTSGPALLGVAPTYGDIEPDQYFVTLIDGAVDPKSVEAKAYFEVEGMRDRVGINIITGSDRESVIKASLKNNWRWKSYKNLLEQKPVKPFSQIKEMENFIVLAGNRRFPEGVKVVLHWPQGILSTSGLPVEEAQQFEFNVIKPFEAKFSCERTAPDRPCNPILDMTLNFSARVPLKSLAGAKLVSSNGKTWTAVELIQGDQNKNIDGTLNTTPKTSVGVKIISNFEDKQVEHLTFKAPFPEATKFKLVLPSKIRDELQRPLSNQKKYPLEIATDEYSPLVKFPSTFGILELKADPILPVSVRNIEKQMAIQQVTFEGKSLNLSNQSTAAEIIGWYKNVSSKEYDYEKRGSPILSEGVGTKFQLPKPLGARELELVGIPLKKPGFYVVEMASPKLGQALIGSSPMYVSTAALVTDMAVHFKKGRESSLIWVTELSTAKPVIGANVAILDSKGKELAKGVTNKDGVLRLGVIKYPCHFNADSEDSERYDYNNCEIFAFAQKGEDVSFSSSEWSKGIESYRFNISNEYLNRQWGPMVMHTVLDRMAAQPGDAIQMKHVVREHRENGFAMMNQKRLPKRVLIVHQGSQKTYTLPFNFDKSTGTAIGKFTIPKDASLGRYSIYLSNKNQLPKKENEESEPFDWSAQETGHFVVSEYRLPLMKASVKIQGTPLVRPLEVKTDLSANYLSGGPAKGLKVKLRASLQPGSFTPDVPGGAEYSFFATPLKAGVIDSENRQSLEEAFLKVQDLALNSDGGLLAKVTDLPKVTKIQELTLEMEYTDPNGEVKTTSSQVPLFPANSVVGLRSDSWYAEAGKTKVMGVITNNLGKPLSGQTFTVEAFQSQYITHRKRLVGGFYSYDSKTVVTALGKVCEGKSDDLGRFTCEAKNLPSGSITLQAKTSDDKGRSTFASVGVSVYEAGSDNWWVPSDSDRIDLLPEKNRYEPGEKAKLLVRSPYPVSQVLVTVEREGVLDSFVTEVRRDNPVIEVPMKGNYAPNVFISALAVRGRVGDPKPTALLDLARPAMKMGMTELKVGWKAHELLVTVKPDKTKYRAREKAQVTIKVRTASGEKLPSGSEVAVAAVDESLLRLKENTSWKILREMMGQRSLAVSTSSGQNQVVGRRHFGSKAKPPGGGGGQLAADARELFEPVLLWQPKLKLNSSGEAKITIPLNDSMTSFRIVAVAIGGENYFGDGNENIESSKDLIIFSGFAPLAREGDQIKNAFTLRNTTIKPMKVSLDVTSAEVGSLPKLSPLDLQPSEAKTLDLPLTVPMGLKEISFRIQAKDSLTGAEDSMIAKVRVEPAVPARVLQATLFQLDKTFQIPVKQPADALAGKGGLSVHARSTLVSGLAGVKSHLEDYPYTCLEQQVSRGIVLENKNEVKRLIEALPSYLDSQGLLKFFSISNCGSPQLTRYIMNILDENGFEIPQATRTRLISGLTSYVQGQYSCLSWWDNFVRDPYLGEAKVLAMETLSRHKAFTPNLLSLVQITPNTWKTETATAWFQLLKRQTDIPNRDDLLKQAESILRARVNFQGSLMNLQGDLDWEGQWRLFTSRDQEAMGVFAVSMDEPTWNQDVGRMARGLVARLRLGRWDTTMANAWGVTQFRKFSSKFEAQKITGETKVSATGINSAFDWQSSPNGERRLLNWPKGSEKTSSQIQFNHLGEGRPWIHFETISAIPLKAPLDMGYKISRKVTAVVQATPGAWKVGDVANVELTVTAKADQPWVVVRDPIPAGSTHLGTGLDGSSSLLDRAPKPNSANGEVQDWPTEYEEKAQANFMSYAAYLPRGTYRLNYRVRLNSEGEFKLPPSRVEAMYSPESFGEAPNANWNVSK